jgi:hypothetical protein
MIGIKMVKISINDEDEDYSYCCVWGMDNPAEGIKAIEKNGFKPCYLQDLARLAVAYGDLFLEGPVIPKEGLLRIPRKFRDGVDAFLVRNFPLENMVGSYYFPTKEQIDKMLEDSIPYPVSNSGVGKNMVIHKDEFESNELINWMFGRGDKELLRDFTDCFDFFEEIVLHYTWPVSPSANKLASKFPSVEHRTWGCPADDTNVYFGSGYTYLRNSCDFMYGIKKKTEKGPTLTLIPNDYFLETLFKKDELKPKLVFQ